MSVGDLTQQEDDALALNGLVLSSGMDSVIILWDIQSGMALRRYQGHTGGGLRASPSHPAAAPSSRLP